MDYLHKHITYELKNVEEIIIDMELPIESRLENYIRQIKNPYHFTDDNVKVNIFYNDNKEPLYNSLKDCFINDK